MVPKWLPKTHSDWGEYFILVLTFVSMLGLIAVMTGCSTIHSRILENSGKFDTYSTAIQERIKRGEIDTGFTEDMVYMAKGKPSRTTTRRQNSHVIATWYYNRPGMTPVPGSNSDSLSSPYGYPVVGPGPVRPVGVVQDIPSVIIQFEDSRVVQWTE